MKVQLQKYAWSVPLVVMLILPFLNLDLFYEGFLVLVFMYACVASGWNILTGYTGYFSFGHVAFFGLGAYTTALLFINFGISPLAGCVMGGGVAVLFALLVGYPTLRLKGGYFAIATMSLGFALQIAFNNLTSYTGGGEGLSLPLPPWGPRISMHIFYYFMSLVLVISTATTYYLDKSRFGLAFRCIRDDEVAAESSGIPTAKLKMMAFLMSAFFPGVVGGLYSYYATYLDPTTVFDPRISLFAIVFTLFGASGSVLGPIIGTVVLFSLNDLLTFASPVPGLDLAVFGGLAMAVILFLPQGVLGLLREKYDVKLP